MTPTPLSTKESFYFWLYQKWGMRQYVVQVLYLDRDVGSTTFSQQSNHLRYLLSDSGRSFSLSWLFTGNANTQMLAV